MSVGALALGVRGIVGKELRSRTRGFWRPMLQLTFYLGLVALAVVAVLAVSVSTTGTLSPRLGDTLFSTLVSGSVLLIAFIAPGLTAASISGERERLTLDLLLVTRASPLGLVAGKLAGALLWIGYLVVASLPALAIVNLFGGVPLLKAAAAICVIAATALTYASLGLALSAIFRRTVLATVLAYAGVLLTVIVVPILAVSLAGFVSSIGSGIVFASVGRATNAPLGVPPPSTWLAFLSPVMALVSLLGGALGPLQSSGSAGFSILSTYTERNTIAGPERLVSSLAPWAFYSLLSLLFSLACLVVSALAVRPPRVWRRGR